MNKYLYGKTTKVKMLKDDRERKYKYYSPVPCWFGEFKAITSGTGFKHREELACRGSLVTEDGCRRGESGPLTTFFLLLCTC